MAILSRTLGLLALSSAISLAHAELLIQVTKAGDDARPIAIVPFANDRPGESLAEIIKSDLAQTGLFRPVNDLPGHPSSLADIRYPDWNAARIDPIVVGQVNVQTPGLFGIQYDLASAAQQKRLSGETLNNIAPSRWRDAAHYMSDRIFEQLTGKPGAFRSHIAYVLQYSAGGATRYRLEVSDADGQRPQTVLDSPEPILSPAWSPDGKKIAYVSFESRRPAVIVQNLATQQRDVLSRAKGLNGAPSWSPDGTRLALTLSQDGNPEIYILNVADKSLTRMTNHYAIDTEARWMPDGKSLIFTSDRGGSPQIYRLDIDSRDVKRLTFDGNFNARGSVSPDGRWLAMVHRERGQTFQIAIQDLQSGGLSTLTSTPLDESPSFSPNSQMLVYATRQDGRGVLGIMSLDGRFKITLPASDGQVREPAWSP